MATTPAKKAVPSLKELQEKNKTTDPSAKETKPDEQTKYESQMEGNPDGVTFSGKNMIDKTPNELSMETPKESAERYRIDNTVNDANDENPNVNVNKDMRNSNEQIASGTHLHPDIAKDPVANRNLSNSTDMAYVTTSGTKSVFAEEAENDDKGRQGMADNNGDDDGTIFEGVENNFSPENENNDKPVLTEAEKGNEKSHPTDNAKKND